MTKTFSAALAALLCAGICHTAAAQTALSETTPHVWPLEALLSQAQVDDVSEQGHDASRFPMPWMYTFGEAQIISDPVVLERSIAIAIREGILGTEVEPYYVTNEGFGQIAYIGSNIVPEGWVVTAQCMARSGILTDESPLGRCHVYEMRELLSDATSVAWD